MSAFLATVAVVGLFALLFAPLLLAHFRPAASLPVAVGYAVLLTLTAGYQSALLEAAPLADDPISLSGPTVTAAQCVEILTLLDRAGAIADRRSAPRLVVVDPAWSRLPEDARQIVVTCVERSWQRESGSAQVEVRAQ